MATTPALAPATRTLLEDEVEELVESARSLIEASRAPSTRSAYERDFADFELFCSRLGQSALPAAPEVVGLYVAELTRRRELATSTVNRRLSAISVAHAEVGHDSPTAHPVIRRMLSGLRRSRAGEMTNERRALGVNELDVLLNPLGDGAADTRDRALILVGFVGGLRRSELVAIDFGDLTKTDRGYKLLVRTSKTDQEGRGRTVIPPTPSTRRYAPFERSIRGYNSPTLKAVLSSVVSVAATP